jgi:hypothetical protein
MSNQKITIAVVTYHRDFLLLKRMLQSVYTCWNPAQVDSIYVILNDKSRYFKDFNKIIKENSNVNFKINKLYTHDLEPEIEHYDWHSQQLLKCLISKKINTTWYVINDCKDYYTQPVDISDMFDDQGRATMHLDHTRYPSDDRVPPMPTSTWAPGPFSLALKCSFELFGIDPQDHRTIHFPSTTPFLIKTEIMKGMIAELKSITKGLFPFLFSIEVDGQCFVTEFLLYGAYCYATTKNRDYVDWNINHRKFFIGVNQSKDLRISDLNTNTAFCNDG